MVLRHFALWSVNNGRNLFPLVCVYVHECVCPFSLQRVSVFFADCDNNSEDHCLLGIIERGSVTLPFWCSFITVEPLLSFLTGTHIHTNTSRNWARACQGGDILIHYVRTGLFFSLAFAIMTAKAQQPNNASTGARRHTEVLETLHLFRGGEVGASKVRLERWHKVHARSHTATAINAPRETEQWYLSTPGTPLIQAALFGYQQPPGHQEQTLVSLHPQVLQLAGCASHLITIITDVNRWTSDRCLSCLDFGRATGNVAREACYPWLS